MDIFELRKLCRAGAVKWTTHVLARLQERGINPSDIFNCIENGCIIEDYPDDYPFPSCLILGSAVNGTSIHSVIGVGEDNLWLITAYYPNIDDWKNNFTKRKEQ
ncbi:hypothetical protein FACS1894105_12620 [Clostridia bacterium]|nr:hypothetical protein FACS1894105_12620 [Clostridia bacterium]